MTEAGARTTATVVLVGAGLAAAYVVVTTPPLRRLARGAVRVWLGASLPAYLFTTIRQAWVESAPRA